MNRDLIKLGTSGAASVAGWKLGSNFFRAGNDIARRMGKKVGIVNRIGQGVIMASLAVCFFNTAWSATDFVFDVCEKYDKIMKERAYRDTVKEND